MRNRGSSAIVGSGHVEKQIPHSTNAKAVMIPSNRLTTVLAALAFAVLSPGAHALGQTSAEYDFNRDIRPVLSGKCFHCHGPDAAGREVDLRLDKRGDAIDYGAIVPGAPEESVLIDRITSDDPDERMPPNDKPLSTKQVAKLTAWIKDGAPYEKHWSFQPPKAPTQPAVRDQSWPASKLDYFILKRIEQAGLKPSPEAKPAVLLRRLYLDLIGLPPSVEDVRAFEANPSPKNYEAQVDRLLRSKHFGEKWAAGWLDLARYADSNGYQHDDLRTMWPYRDWVIKALNDDMPFDRFTIEQLAGDLLPNPSTSQLVATGFNRNVPTNFSGGTKVPEVRANVLHDRVATTGAVWLGLTLECAQCHDHKFDDISQKEYYQLYAYYNKAIPEFDQQGDGMFRKYFTGRDVLVYANEADRIQGREIDRKIALEEERIAALKELADDEANPSQSDEAVLLDFEGPDPFEKSNATRPAVNSVVEDVPADGGSYAVKIVAQPVTETKGFSERAFRSPPKTFPTPVRSRSG